MRDLLSNMPNCYVCVEEFLTSPLEYKYRVIFVLILALFVLYEVQLDNNAHYFMFFGSFIPVHDGLQKSLMS